jgi:hypothetical protein
MTSFDRTNNHVTHLLVGPYGSPNVECKARGASFGADFRDYNAAVKAGGISEDACCKRCHAAYIRRLEKVRARKAATA